MPNSENSVIWLARLLSRGSETVVASKGEKSLKTVMLYLAGCCGGCNATVRGHREIPVQRPATCRFPASLESEVKPPSVPEKYYGRRMRPWPFGACSISRFHMGMAKSQAPPPPTAPARLELRWNYCQLSFVCMSSRCIFDSTSGLIQPLIELTTWMAQAFIVTE